MPAISDGHAFAAILLTASTATSADTATASKSAAPTFIAGTVTTSWKTSIKGNGKTGGGNFEYEGTFNDQGLANTKHIETKGNRTGPFAIDLSIQPK